MEVIYQWDILESETNSSNPSFPDTIKRIKFALVAYDALSNGDENTFRMHDVYLPEPNENSFKKLSELTHADYVKFIIDTCGEQKIQDFKQDMINEIEYRYTKKQEANKLKSPWDNFEVVIDENLPKFNSQLEYLESLKSNG